MSKKKSTNLTDTYLARLHLGARQQTQQNAKQLRQGETEAEKKIVVLTSQQPTEG